MTDPVTFRYRAFLSYSHRDTAWAKWLHGALEKFRIDKDLAGRATPVGLVPKTLRPIFRDRDDFSAGHSLTEQTANALAASQFMVVLCSPNAARSHYVNEEIKSFKSLGHSDRIIPLIVDGEPGDPERECFPAALLFKLAPDGSLSEAREEPIAADARPQGDGKEIAKLKLVAGLLGVGFDEIVRRADHARRRRNRILGVVASAFFALAVSAGASAVYAYNKLIESEENLDYAVEMAYGFVSEAAAEADRFGVSVATIAKLLRRAEQGLDSLIAAGRDTAQLRYRQSLMLLSFAENYQKLGQTQDALERAQSAQMRLTEVTSRAPARISWQRDLAIAHNRLGDIQLEQGALAPALSNHRSARAILGRLTGRDPARLDWQIDLARTFEKIGNVLGDQGSLADALESYRQSLAISESAIGRAADNNDARQTAALQAPTLQAATFQVATLQAAALQAAAIAHQRVGYVLFQQGSMGSALEHYRSSLMFRERLAASNVENNRSQRELLGLHNEIGDTLKSRGSLTEALASYRKSHEIAERLAKSDSKNAQWQRELTVSLLRIGDVLLAQRQLTEALENFRSGLAIVERLSAADPANLTWLRDVAIWHDRIALVQDDLGESEVALASYRKSLAITERLARTNTDNAIWQHDLALGYSRLGDLLIARTRFDDALRAFNISLTITERAATSDASNSALQRDIAVLHGRIASVFRSQSKLNEALATDRKALSILERLSAADPSDTRLQRDVLVSNSNIGDELVGLGAVDKAMAHYRTSLRIAERLAQSDRENVQWQLDLASTQLHLAILDDERPARLVAAATILRGLKTADKLTTDQEALLIAVERMLESSAPPH